MAFLSSNRYIYAIILFILFQFILLSGCFFLGQKVIIEEEKFVYLPEIKLLGFMLPEQHDLQQNQKKSANYWKSFIQYWKQNKKKKYTPPYLLLYSCDGKELKSTSKWIYPYRIDQKTLVLKKPFLPGTEYSEDLKTNLNKYLPINNEDTYVFGALTDFGAFYPVSNFFTRSDLKSVFEKKTPQKHISFSAPLNPTFKKVPTSHFDKNNDIIITFPDNEHMRFKFVQPGSFYYGSTEKEAQKALREIGVRVDYETPQTVMKISNGFWIAEKELTRAQFFSYLFNDRNTDWSLWKQLFDYWRPQNRLNVPMTYINQSHIYSFLLWMNATQWKKRKPLPEYQFDLPTEIEWEYAAKGKAGKYSKVRLFPWGNGEKLAHTKAVFSAHNSIISYPEPVGRKIKGKSWCGAYDMAGNVHELCKNFFYDYNEKYTNKQLLQRNTIMKDIRKSVARGGAYNTTLWECRCSSRYDIFQDLRQKNVGARIVLVIRK